MRIKNQTFVMRPRQARADEREHLWAELTKIYPVYNNNQKKTKRVIPVAVLEPARSDHRRADRWDASTPT